MKEYIQPLCSESFFGIGFWIPLALARPVFCTWTNSNKETQLWLIKQKKNWLEIGSSENLGRVIRESNNPNYTTKHSCKITAVATAGQVCIHTMVCTPAGYRTRLLNLPSLPPLRAAPTPSPEQPAVSPLLPCQLLPSLRWESPITVPHSCPAARETGKASVWPPRLLLVECGLSLLKWGFPLSWGGRWAAEHPKGDECPSQRHGVSDSHVLWPQQCASNRQWHFKEDLIAFLLDTDFSCSAKFGSSYFSVWWEARAFFFFGN